MRPDWEIGGARSGATFGGDLEKALVDSEAWNGNARAGVPRSRRKFLVFPGGLELSQGLAPFTGRSRETSPASAAEPFCRFHAKEGRMR